VKIYEEDFSVADEYTRGTFVHELGHVLQHQEGVPLRALAIQIWKDGGYKRENFYRTYTPDPSLPYLEQNIEQQAELWRQHYLQRRAAGFVK
jgi:hypothetical protein